MENQQKSELGDETSEEERERGRVRRKVEETEGWYFSEILPAAELQPTLLRRAHVMKGVERQQLFELWTFFSIEQREA